MAEKMLKLKKTQKKMQGGASTHFSSPFSYLSYWCHDSHSTTESGSRNYPTEQAKKAFFFFNIKCQDAGVSQLVQLRICFLTIRHVHQSLRPRFVKVLRHFWLQRDASEHAKGLLGTYRSLKATARFLKISVRACLYFQYL